MDSIGKVRQPATDGQIREAIESLDDVDLIRLEKFASTLMYGARQVLLGNTSRDMLQEALTRTLEGRRIWNPDEIGFKEHLFRTIRSIVSEAWEKAMSQTHSEPLFESEMAGVTGRGSPGALAAVGTNSPNPMELLETSDSITAIRDYFREDTLVLEIMDGWAEGLKGPDIREILGITQKDLESATKRLRRSLPRIFQ